MIPWRMDKHRIEIYENLNRLIKDGLIEADALSPTWLNNRGLEVGENGLIRESRYVCEYCGKHSGTIGGCSKPGSLHAFVKVSD